MPDVIIGKGKLAGKGVYANRNFRKGEVVIAYRLTKLSQEEWKKLPRKEKMFTHVQKGVHYLYAEPERYVNHSKNPNTYQDLARGCDVAAVDIKKGGMITTDAAKDDLF